MIMVEFALTILAALLALLFPNSGAGMFSRIESWASTLARHRKLTVFAIGLSALVLRAALLPVFPIPEPVVHDEFSHLLAADTFAHRRLANLTHPMWIHFETFHVIQKPTYASMYYPGQGLFLALGQLLGGHPFWGVWLSAGLMCGAICWMLQGWLAPFWALMGGVLAVMRLGIFSYWANSYWGGAVAATGGALVLGALPRIKSRQQVGDALLMGLGLALLANSRPYESVFFCLPIFGSLAVCVVGMCRSSWAQSVRQVLLPLSLISAITLAGMGYYFWRVTGSPFQIPYQVNIRTYGLIYFPWQTPSLTLEYHHPVMRSFYQGYAVLGQYRFARSHPLQLLFLKAAVLWPFFLGPLLTLPVVAALAIAPYGMRWRDIIWKARFLLLVCGFTAVGLALPIYLPEAHYAAPLTAAIYALILMGLQRVRRWRFQGRRSGLALVRLMFSTCGLLFVLRIAASALHLPIPEPFPHTWSWPSSPLVFRSPTLQQLSQYNGLHLVLVRYRPDHDPIQEWVYNSADIDTSRVVWAREMNCKDDKKLLEYFEGRRVWLLEADEMPPKLSPYKCAP